MRNCIGDLNNAISQFKEEVCRNDQSRNTVDVAIVEFNDEVRVVQDFVPISNIEQTNLRADGYTAMGTAINTAIDLVKKRNRLYDSLGTPFFKPWIFMITDGRPEGEPSSEIERARQRIAEEENKKPVGKLKFFAVAVDHADQELLKSLTKRVMILREAKFEGVFDWLSDSMVQISVSSPEDEPQLPPLPPGISIPDW